MSLDRPGMAEFANTPDGVHRSPPTDTQMAARKKDEQQAVASAAQSSPPITPVKPAMPKSDALRADRSLLEDLREFLEDTRANESDEGTNDEAYSTYILGLQQRCSQDERTAKGRANRYTTAACQKREPSADTTSPVYDRWRIRDRRLSQ